MDSLLVAGSSHRELAREVARIAALPYVEAAIESFPDREIGVQILENVRGKNVFVFQSPARRPNHFLMELCILVDALKRASARSIIAVMPYFAYARQDRKNKGCVPITAKLVADLLQCSGVNHLLTMDLHTEQMQGFFDIPVDELYARPLFVEVIRSLRLKNFAIVSPDIGSNKMARKFGEQLQCDVAIVDKRRTNGRDVEVYALIGDVQGKQVVIVDDICSTGVTLQTAARLCREKGANRVIAMVTHGLLMGAEEIEGIDELYITDTVMPLRNTPAKLVTVAPLLAEAIKDINI